MTDYEFTYNGLTFGSGHPVGVYEVDGLEDMPALRTSDDDRGGDDGAFLGQDLLSARLIEMKLRIVAGEGLTFRQAIDAYKSAMVPSRTGTETLTFTLGGDIAKRCEARCRRRTLPSTLNVQFGLAEASVQFFAPDPRLYAEAPSSAVLSLPAAAGGFAFNAAFNLSFGTTVSPNTVVASNAGNVATRPAAVITGPVENPYLQNTTTGGFVRFAITLAAADWLTVDFANRTVTLNGTASRRSTMSTDSTWWELIPGSNTILYSAAAQTASTATLTWRSAYL